MRNTAFGLQCFGTLLEVASDLIKGFFHPGTMLGHDGVGVDAEKLVCGEVGAAVGIYGLHILIAARCILVFWYGALLPGQQQLWLAGHQIFVDRPGFSGFGVACQHLNHVVDLHAAAGAEAEAVPVRIVLQIGQNLPDQAGRCIDFHRDGGNEIGRFGH